MSCFLYRILDWFKQTRLASVLFFYGNRFQHFEPITRSGIVLTPIMASTDGDISFDLNDYPAVWHCEVTPCQPAALRQLAQTLKVGDHVRVSGTRTYDPDHHILWIKFRGGLNEIHPVTRITKLF